MPFFGGSALRIAGFECCGLGRVERIFVQLGYWSLVLWGCCNISMRVWAFKHTHNMGSISWNHYGSRRTLFIVTGCERWCAARAGAWATKCTRNSCSACPECSDKVVPGTAPLSWWQLVMSWFRLSVVSLWHKIMRIDAARDILSVTLGKLSRGVKNIVHMC